MARVRPLEAGDRAEWARLWAAYHAHGGAPVAAGLTQSVWRRLLDRHGPMRAMVAPRDGGLAGFAHFTFHDSTSAVAPVCCLQDLFVDDAQRGQGLGRMLIEAVFAHARAAGAARVYWHVQAGNAAARQLYDKTGGASGHLLYRATL